MNYVILQGSRNAPENDFWTCHEEWSMKSGFILGAACMIGSVLTSNFAFAGGCTYAGNYEKHEGINAVWTQRVEYSNDAGLKKAFQEGGCKFKKGVHNDKSHPTGAAGVKHVTVWYEKTKATFTCHVYANAAGNPPANLSPTTCKRN